jgi:hypothetical protein
LAASQVKNSNMVKNHLDVYSPFRLLADFAGQNYDLKNLNTLVYNSSSGNDIYAKRELLNYLTTLYE